MNSLQVRKFVPIISISTTQITPSLTSTFSIQVSGKCTDGYPCRYVITKSLNYYYYSSGSIRKLSGTGFNFMWSFEDHLKVFVVCST